MNYTTKNSFRCRRKDGFSLTELMISTAIAGTLSAIAYPNYVNSNHKSQQSEAKATMMSIPAIIGAYIDSTGESPSTWENLSSIAVVMTDNGPAKGNLSSTITLPNSIYDLSIEEPTKSLYVLTATRVVDRIDSNLENKEEDIENNRYKYAIKSCFNASNGASDVKTGVLSDIETELNCG